MPSTAFRRHPSPVAVILWAIAATCLTVVGTATADPVGDIGADDRLVVRGMTQIDPERLRLTLVDDDVLAWLSRPHDSRDEFLEGVVGRATLALQRAGFPAPQVRATVEPAAGLESAVGGERLAVDVVEGERLIAGRIEVTGLPDETAARLVTFLSARQPPLDAVPRSVDRPDGSTDTIWVDAGDRPARFLDPEWTPGGPAACDPIAERSIRAAVARFLRDDGHLAIAPLVERSASVKHPRGVTSTVRSKWIDASGTHDAFDVSLRRAGGVADLVVAVKDLPPKTTLRGIELSADCTTRREDLATFLGITIGTAVTERDRIGWRDRLRMSGRFLRHEVELRADPTDAAAVVARFDLEEYPRATPLREPLSRAETTMLRFREWMVGATRAGDLIIDVRRREGEAAPAGPAARERGSDVARLVVSPADGLVLTAMPGADTACGLVASGTQFSLVSPGHAGRLDVPLPARTRVTATIGLTLARDASSPEQPPKCLHNLSFGCGLMSVGAADGGGVQIEMRIEPVACLAMVHERDPVVSFEGDTLVIVATGATSRVDAASGRPLSLAVDGYELAADAREGGLEAAVASLDGTAGPNRFRDAAPVTSAVEFLASDGVAEACGRLAAAAGMPLDEPPCAAIVPVATAVRRCLAGCLADGVIAPCDAAVVAARSAEPSVAALEMPQEDAGGSSQVARKATVRKVAAFAWECTEDHCGRDSWPASLARAAASGLVGDPAIFREMTDFMAQDDYGPLAHACAAVLSPVPAIARSLALRGQERLSTIAFHTDCRPLLQALGRYGIDDCCASVLRSIDDDAARDLGRSACGDPEMLLPLIRALRSHAGPADAADVLQPALDAWWEQTLRGRVAAWLDAMARPRTAASPAGDAAPVKK